MLSGRKKRIQTYRQFRYGTFTGAKEYYETAFTIRLANESYSALTWTLGPGGTRYNGPYGEAPHERTYVPFSGFRYMKGRDFMSRSI